MGSQKLLLPLAGKPVIARVVDAILASGCDPVLVVVGADNRKIQEALEGCVVQFVSCDDGSDEMLASVRRGLKAVPGNCRSVLVALGDTPGITSSLIDQMVSMVDTGDHEIVVPTYAGKRGHPLIFSLRFKEEIMTEFDGTGLRGLLLKHPDLVHEMPCTLPATLEDIDTPEAYKRQLAAFRSKRVGSR